MEERRYYQRPYSTISIIQHFQLTFLTLLLFHSCIQSTNALSREERVNKHRDLFDFPYIGRGDADHSFLHPYIPSPGGDAINHWFQLGSTLVSRSKQGRDIIRLTGAGQGNQGVLYNSVRTTTNNFNGYIDIEIETVKESNEAADGMGFFFIKSQPELGSAMGISERIEGLGLIIDTFSNSRVRHTPYLYAYISDGLKTWNPDTDGSDTEITKGCQLELNTQIRIYIQYIDEELHVGVAMNPRTPHRWHTCFKASNVKLPFSNGGYLAFAGETGHFYALHQVHDAAFVDESDYGGHEHHQTEYVNQVYTQHDQQLEQQQQHDHHQQHPPHEHEQHQKQQQEQQQHVDGRQQVEHAAGERGDASKRIHKGGNAEESLSGSLDLQVHDIFNSMSNALKGVHDKDSEEAKLRIDGVRDVTSHLIEEMQKQESEMGSIITLLNHLKDSVKELSADTHHFQSQIKDLHSTIATLRDSNDRQASRHEQVKQGLTNVHSSLINKSKSKGSAIVILFFVLQLLMAAGVFALFKLNISPKRPSRMV